ncbi:MAG: hypothetical protein ACFFC7_25365 [Candidatus Hermodarchaeota archaeon]
MKQNHATKWLGKRATLIRGVVVVTFIFAMISILLLFSFQSVLTWGSPLLSEKTTSNFLSVNPPLRYENGDPRVINWRPEGSQTWGTEITTDNNGSIYTVGDIEYLTEEEIVLKHLLLSKWDSNGTQLWYRIWGDIDCEVRGRGVAVDTIGNVYTTGCMDCSSSYGSVLVKWDGAGNQVWNCTWKGWIERNGGQSVIVGSDGNIYTIGYTYTYTYHPLLTKWNIAGNQVWNRTWEGAVGVAIDFQDEYIYTIGYNYNTSEDLRLVKWDTAGNRVWNRTWENALTLSFPDDQALWTGLAVDTGGNVYTTGSTRGSFVLLKWDGAGNQLWSRTREAGVSHAKITIGGVNNSIYTIGSRVLRYKSTKGIPMEDITVLKWDTEGNLLRIQSSGYQGCARGIDISSDDKICATGISGELPDHTLQLVIFSSGNFSSIPSEYTSGFAVPIIIFTVFLLSFLNKRRRRTLSTIDK